jgi:hypothetical protein
MQTLWQQEPSLLFTTFFPVSRTSPGTGPNQLICSCNMWYLWASMYQAMFLVLKVR